ncbi:MAG: glycosyl transferase family 28 [Chitinophagaceae bacterium]|nr:glycosyl transferase family 28 [Chitinophagaceae bacterium]
MNTRKPVVLLAPLDWGLGHTIRCIPIIHELIVQGCEVLVACNSKQKLLLTEEFPSLGFADLIGYDIYYGNNRLQTIFNIVRQVPKILTRINREKSWLESFLLKNRVSAVISDNRYGFFSTSLPCVFITHQLKIKSGLGFLIDGLIQKILYSYINKFTECWIPDWKDSSSNAAGSLSHPEKFPRLAVKYIGCLSRFEKCDHTCDVKGLLIVLSGPEPQRSILENALVDQLKAYNGPATVVRGVFGSQPIAPFNQINFLDRVPSKELNRMICNAETLLCRAGYTTIMDILKLRKKSILIPTPGQAEQEYLAVHMHEKKVAVTMGQEDFCLDKALKTVLQFQPLFIGQSMNGYKKTIEELVSALKKPAFLIHPGSI